MQIINDYENKLNSGKIKRYEDSDAENVASIYLDYSVVLTGRDVLLDYSSIDNPITFGSFFTSSNTVNIDKDYFKENKDIVINTIISICNSTKVDHFYINDTSLITKDVIYAIANNKNISTVKLGNQDDPYTFTKEVYDWFKKCNSNVEVLTDKIDPELSDNYDPIIGLNRNKYLIGYYNYNSLQTSKYINLSNIKREELPNLKYLNSNLEEITIDADKVDLDLLFSLLKELNGINKDFNIVVKVDDKNKFNDYIFNNLDNIPNFKLNLKKYINPFGILDYIKYEKKLLDLVKDAEGLSPFEKYLYAYNKVKQFKEYKENDNNRNEARNLYSILENDYIVCVGFSALLEDLLNKLGIESYAFSIEVDTTFDKMKSDDNIIPEDTEVMKGIGHQRVMVHLDDPKYDINGYYTADATWDNSLKNDLYNHALMSSDEVKSLDRYTYMNFRSSGSLQDLLESTSLDEFYKKVNYYLDNDTFSKSEDDKYSNFFRRLKETLIQLDKNLLKEVLNRYGNITQYNRHWSKEELEDIMLFLGESVIKMSNNPVDYDKYRKALITLYRDIYDLDDYEEEVDRILSINDKNQEWSFPKRTKESKDGTITTVLDSSDKFKGRTL